MTPKVTTSLVSFLYSIVLKKQLHINTIEESLGVIEVYLLLRISARPLLKPKLQRLIDVTSTVHIKCDYAMDF
tara:strand:- start:132 stop:350 length:219 start_codon:yes stop_codon:yes gene_type:complete